MPARGHAGRAPPRARPVRHAGRAPPHARRTPLGCKRAGAASDFRCDRSRPVKRLYPARVERHERVTGAGRSASNGRRADRRPRILIAEDDESLRALIRLTIEVGEVEIHEAADGEAALADAQRIRPDLVLLDWSMRGRSGLDVCRALRADERTSGATIVMITAR